MDSEERQEIHIRSFLNTLSDKGYVVCEVQGEQLRPLTAEQLEDWIAWYIED
jgi:hypothetical protein